MKFPSPLPPFLPLLLLLATTAISPLSATPLISEFMGKNKTTIADEDGAYSDWVEIYNPDPAAVSLNQWYLTDSAGNLKKWRFPDVTLGPGEFMLVWCSGKNRRVPGAPLHTSFSLDGDGEYLALVKPDGATVVQDFAPKFPAQGDDQSYGLLFTTTTLLPQGAPGRYQVPTATDPAGTTWLAAGYNDSAWASGPTGFGYGLLVPGITLKQSFKNGGISGNADCDDLLARADNDPLVLRTATAVFPVVNTLGDGPEVHFASSNP
ncbi:MAG: Spore coat protein CotH, partial [Akkermansiaceae bacterium]|nr:Spore coat protein CotH [Akkermansiaceae bacterium]